MQRAPGKALSERQHVHPEVYPSPTDRFQPHAVGVLLMAATTGEVDRAALIRRARSMLEDTPGDELTKRATTLAALEGEDDLPAEAAEQIVTQAAELVGLPKVEPLELDLDADPDPPAYVVEGMFEQDTVNIVTGDTGAAKSILFQDASVAAVTGRKWIGRAIHADRILYLDEENPKRTVRRRLRAMGARNEHREGLRYYNRVGVELGTPEWNAWLRGEIEDHRADLVFIDTAMSSTAVEVNENDSVVKLYKALKQIVSETGACIVVLHHNRKDSQAGRRGDASMAALGARQWAGQADQQFTIRTNGELEITAHEDGSRDKRREFILEGGKDREGEDGRPELIVVESHANRAGALETMTVASEGHVERELSEKDNLAAEIVEAVRVFCAENERPMRTKEIAAAVERDSNHGTFTGALAASVTGKRPRLRKADRGQYEPIQPNSGGMGF